MKFINNLKLYDHGTNHKIKAAAAPNTNNNNNNNILSL
jgi:hypothetical protein